MNVTDSPQSYAGYLLIRWVALGSSEVNLIHSSGAKPLEKVCIFVDVQNIYYTCRQTYQKNFDYNKLWAEATLAFY